MDELAISVPESGCVARYTASVGVWVWPNGERLPFSFPAIFDFNEDGLTFDWVFSRARPSARLLVLGGRV